MMALPYVAAVGAVKTIRTTRITAEIGKTSSTAVIRAKIRSIGEIWTITAVSLIQIDTIKVVDCTTLVVDGIYSTTVLQVGKGVRMIGIMKNLCLGEPKIIISGLVGPEMTRVVSKKGNARINADLPCFMGAVTNRA